jgi:hypothetical protein
MKRPKVADMTPVQLARFRLLQCRRAAKRCLTSSALDHMTVRRCATVITLTKPSWVANASEQEAAAVLQHIGGQSH